MKRWIGVLVVVAGIGLPGNASAALITFIHTGTGSGTIGQTGFSSAAFTFTGVSDTANRQTFPGGFWIAHDSASVAIAGVGNYTFTTGTLTFVNNDTSTPGFSRGGGDLYNGPTNAVFGSWDMLSSIGPIPGPMSLLQWTLSPVVTSGGTLVFNSATEQGTFQARTNVIPEPSTLAIWSLLALCGIGYGWRRRKAA